MEMISDILLIAGALGAAFYCIILSRRLSRFTNLDTGVGGAIAVLSAQVDDMTRTLGQAQGTAGASTVTLQTLTERAEDVARRLELLVASMHDLPANGEVPPRPTAQAAAPEKPAEFRAPPNTPAPAPPVEPIDIFRSSRAWGKEAAE